MSEGGIAIPWRSRLAVTIREFRFHYTEKTRVGLVFNDERSILKAIEIPEADILCNLPVGNDAAHRAGA
ncbi:MAG TPA: hypothetical protein DEB39_00995 [Planctomycetaceae bacterium]|nr:hypothetical protein [Planctomycetaceae bacterium]